MQHTEENSELSNKKIQFDKIQQIIEDHELTMSDDKALDFLNEIFKDESHQNLLEMTVESRGLIGLTLLMLAAVYSKTKIFKFLLDHGSDITTQHDRTGSNCVHFAALFGHTDALKVTFQGGKNKALMEARNINGCTPLILAAAYGHQESFQYLLDQCANINGQIIGSEWNCVHLAARNGHINILRIIFHYRINKNLIDFPSRDGSTALILAAGHGQIESFKFLLHKKADCRRVNTKNQFSAAHVAAAEGYLSILMIIFNRMRDDQYLLEHVIDTGWNILSLAAGNGRVNIFNFLLKKGAKIDTRNEKNQSTAIHLAASTNQVEILKCIFEHENFCQDFLHLRNAKGMTPLMIAAISGSVDSFKYLCGKDLGGLINTNNAGLNAIHIAIIHGKIDILKAVFDRDENQELLDVCTPRGWTLCKLARKCQHEDIEQYLNEQKKIDMLVEELTIHTQEISLSLEKSPSPILLSGNKLSQNEEDIIDNGNSPHNRIIFSEESSERDEFKSTPKKSMSIIF